MPTMQTFIYILYNLQAIHQRHYMYANRNP